MNILITNDDGIDNIRLQKLASIVSQMGNVYVVAPDTQNSAWQPRPVALPDSCGKDYRFEKPGHQRKMRLSSPVLLIAWRILPHIL